MPLLNFYANHSLDFKNFQNNVIARLSIINIPDDIYLMAFDLLRLQFPGEDLSKFYNIKSWCPPFILGSSDDRDLSYKNIVLIGSMGMSLIITPKHIRLPSGNYTPVDWYSPHNRGIVRVWRAYYFTIISQFGGDHALYVDDYITSSYYDLMEDASLHKFEQALEAHYGLSNKSMFGYSHSEFPNYYIDTLMYNINKWSLI